MHTHTPYRAHGKGVFRKKNGNTYEGEYKYDKCEGFGVYRFNNGDKYEGMWKNGLKTGQGTISWSNGRKFEGRFADDCPIIGELTEVDGKVYSVTYDGTQKFSNGAQPESQELIRTDSPRPSEMKAAAAKLRHGTSPVAATSTPPTGREHESTAPARTAPALPTPPTSSATAAGVAAAASEATAAGGAKASKADEWDPFADIAASVAEAATVPAGGKTVGDVWDPFGPAAAQDPFGPGPAAASNQAFNPFASPAGNQAFNPAFAAASNQAFNPFATPPDAATTVAQAARPAPIESMIEMSTPVPRVHPASLPARQTTGGMDPLHGLL